MEEKQRRMQSAVYDTLNDVDRKCLRTLQIQMHQCAINCYQDRSSNIETVDKCNENCSKEVIAARNYIQNEFNKWQQRIERCVQDCNDAVSDKIPNSRSLSNELEMNKYIKEAEFCASQCIEKHINMLPLLSSKIMDHLAYPNLK